MGHLLFTGLGNFEKRRETKKRIARAGEEKEERGGGEGGGFQKIRIEDEEAQVWAQFTGQNPISSWFVAANMWEVSWGCH